MENLELNPIEKDLRVMLVEKEYDEPWDIDYLASQKENIFKKPTDRFFQILKDLIGDYGPDFVTDEQGMRSEEQFDNGRLASFLEDEDIELEPVEMDDYVKPYLANELRKIEKKQEELRNKYNELYTDSPNDQERRKLDQIISRGQYLQQKYEEKSDEIAYPVRQKWLVMGILEKAKELDKESVKAIHLSSPSHFVGVKTLLESLDVEVDTVRTENRAKTTSQETEAEDLAQIDEDLEISLVPKFESESPERKDILLYFDSDKHASPFDICKASDAGFDLVIPFQNVSNDDIGDLVQDAIFSRGPEGVKHTSFFLGGSDYQKIREMAQTVEKSMFEPFEASVVVDPNGANTTGSAMVAKVKEGLAKIGEGDLSGKKVAILAGTGPVGQVGAMLCKSEGAEVVITSREQEKAERIAEKISEQAGQEIKGRKCSNEEDTREIIDGTDVLLATGPEGVQLVSKDILSGLEEKPKITADVNAVPPTGIEDLGPNTDLEEFVEGIHGIGALVIGNLKNKVEKDLLTEAMKSDKGIFDQWDAYEIAEEKCMKKIKPKATVSQ